MEIIIVIITIIAPRNNGNSASVSVSSSSSNNNNNNNNYDGNTSVAYDFSPFDVFIICVSTHKPDDMFSPQIDGLLSIVEKISKEAKNGALVSIESTIPKGTSKKVFEMLNHRLHVAHAPHRWYALEQEEHGVNQLRGTWWSLSMLSRCNYGVL